ncbi:MAG: YdbH domain-containing protein [Nitrospira sp.]|nr:YdbH domain-containing protein [Nitrospira sp.]
MLSRRYQIGLFFSVLAVVGIYLILPLTASYFLAQGLRQDGYKHVMIQLGYPRWDGMHIPVVAFQQNIGGEQVLISLTNAEISYRLPELVRGRVTRVWLPDVAVQVLNSTASGLDDGEGVTRSQVDDDESPWNLLTAGDLLQRLPILPFDELQLDRVTIFREQATGPLRKVTIAGNLQYRDGELGGHLTFQGRDTAFYGLTVAGHSASTWSATLVSQRLQAVPIVSWNSQAHPNGSQVEIKGQLEVNVRELAPFIALLVPIGPELGKVTGALEMNWTGTAASEATLTSLWRDSRTHLDGNVRLNGTLPALKGVARDITVAYKGTFTGNAMQIGWTLAPGVLVSATVTAQPRIFPNAMLMMLPRGAQPLSIHNREPVKGMLYWAEAPIRTIVEGPLNVTYGKTTGPLVGEFQTTRAEGAGSELVSAEGTYRVTGVVPKGITEMLSAQEAMADLRGTLSLTQASIGGTLAPESFVTAKQILYGTVAVPKATLQLSDVLSVRCDLPDIHCSAGPATVAMRLSTMNVMGQDIHINHGAIVLQLAEATAKSWNAQGRISMGGVSLNLAPLKIPVTDWITSFAVNQTGIRANLRIDAPLHAGLVTAEIEQPFMAGQGTAHGMIGPIAFDGEDRRLSRLISGLPIPVEILDGRVASTIDASWSGGVGESAHGFQPASGTVKIIADKLSGRYDEYVVKDVTTTMTLRADGVGSLATVEPALVTVGSVQIGIEMTNLSTQLQGAWKFHDGLQVIEAKDFRCEMFGGLVTSPGILVDVTKPPYHATVILQDLDLAKVLSVEHNQGIQGTGTLNGTLPVAITSGGLTVKDGMVTALPPGGVIRYGSAPESSKLISETNTQLHLVTQALNNFHYTLLRVGVDYAETGTLLLTARLEGRNPDLKKIPPVNFNLTVQEHIPALLKSLRLVDDIQDAVERKHKRQ